MAILAPPTDGTVPRNRPKWPFWPLHDGAGALAEHGHPAGAHVVVLAVGGGVHPDARPRRHDDVLVEDGPADVGALADVHAVHQHAVLDPGTALHPHAR